MCSIDNTTCRIPVEHLRIQVKQFVKLTAWGGVYRRTFTKGEKIFDGIAPFESSNGFTRYLEIPLCDMKSKVYKHKYTDIDPMDGMDTFLAETLQPTTNGINLNITYHLSVTMQYNTCCSNHPICTIPLFIQAPPLQNFQVVQAPQNWNPTIYNTAELALPVPSNELMQPLQPNFNEHAPLLDPSQNIAQSIPTTPVAPVAAPNASLNLTEPQNPSMPYAPHPAQGYIPDQPPYDPHPAEPVTKSDWDV